jgi:hypothetical protein
LQARMPIMDALETQDCSVKGVESGFRRCPSGACIIRGNRRLVPVVVSAFSNRLCRFGLCWMDCLFPGARRLEGSVSSCLLTRPLARVLSWNIIRPQSLRLGLCRVCFVLCHRLSFTTLFRRDGLKSMIPQHRQRFRRFEGTTRQAVTLVSKLLQKVAYKFTRHTGLFSIWFRLFLPFLI